MKEILHGTGRRFHNRMPRSQTLLLVRYSHHSSVDVLSRTLGVNRRDSVRCFKAVEVLTTPLRSRRSPPSNWIQPVFMWTDAESCLHNHALFSSAPPSPPLVALNRTARLLQRKRGQTSPSDACRDISSCWSSWQQDCWRVD